MKQKLIFDVTDANTIADSDSVGAFIRSSDGTLLTHSTDGAREALDVFTELGKAEDTAHVSGDLGAMILAVRQDVGGTLADTDGDYTPLQVDADGNLRVAATVNVDSNSDYAEDSAHTTGDVGEFMLAVRNDVAGSLVDTDGDYAPFQVDDQGALRVRVDSSGELTVNDAALANTAIATAANTLTASGSSEDIIASPLANRKYLWVYNNDNREMYVGPAGVTAANGFPLPPGAMLELRAGAAIDIEFDSAKSGHAIRTMELS
jgi:hypothetical protein